MLYLKSSNQTLIQAITIPIISSIIIPLVIIDIWMEIYHRTCFPLYKLPYIKRSSYIRIDRHKLKYLTFWQKVFCIYCGYGNGVFNYLVKIAGETEKYWCGIKHKQDKNFVPPAHHKGFANYDDAKDFKRKYKT